MKRIKNIIFKFSGLLTISILILYVNFYKNENDVKNKVITENNLKNLQPLETNVKKTNIKEYLNIKEEECEIEIENVIDGSIYGNCIKDKKNSIVLQTAGVWTYDIETNKLLYYKYNKDNRIWSFFIEGKNIYYIELSENMQNNTFKWSLIKSDLEFNKKKIIDNGILYKPTDTPTFIRKNNSIILHAVYDEIKYKDDFKLTDYKSQFSIKLYKNNNFIELVNKKGNHIKKQVNFPAILNL